MMLKLLTTLTIVSTSLVVSTEAIFLQGLKHQIMCRIAKRKLERLGAKGCIACEKVTDEDFAEDIDEGYFTYCETDDYAAFANSGAQVQFTNRQDQYVAFLWDEPGFFGRYGKATECIAYEFQGEVVKICECEANLLATPIIPGPLSYKISNCQNSTSSINAKEAMTGINALLGGFN